MFIQTTALQKIANLTKRIRCVSGGTSASKTISIVMWLIDYAQCHKNEIISIVSESFPHIKRGSMRDFENIMRSRDYFNEDRWNKTDSIYTFESGSKIEFFSADQPDKVRGPRRDVLFVNEVNNVPFETFTQLEVRTRKIVWLDFNPVSEFYWYTDVAPYMEHDFITLTYRDNEALSVEEIASLEQYKSNPNKANWWRVYGEGMLGEATGRIYTGWQQIDFIPHEARLEGYGLDFGYTNDPTAIVALYKYNDGFILHEIAYAKELSNRAIADIFLNNYRAIVIADSAEPKSIDEIKSYGINIVGATKGQGSVSQGIQYVQDQRISVTKDSTNILKEYKSYLWLTDPKNGKSLGEPSSPIDHTMDAIRYVFSKNFIKLEIEPAYHPPNLDALRQVGISSPYGGLIDPY